MSSWYDTGVRHEIMPIAITKRHIAHSLFDHTRWIMFGWDGSQEQMCNAINESPYEGRPYMLYGGNKEHRHLLHKKLGSNFIHSSIDMDDGSRIMIILNWGGWIYKENDLSVCFFRNTCGGNYAEQIENSVQADARTLIYKMGPRQIAMYLPQQQYESKSDADERIADAQTFDTWRERANKMIGQCY